MQLKTDKVLVMLKKSKEKETWPYVISKQQNTPKVPEMDKDKDPNESLMEMMKTMYDTGDDEMKRTIAKSWAQAQENKASGRMGEMPADF